MAEPKMAQDTVDVRPTVNAMLTYDIEGNQRLPTPRSYSLNVTADLARLFARAFLS